MIKSSKFDYFKFVHIMKKYGIGYDYPSLKPDEGKIQYSYQLSTYNNGISRETFYTDYTDGLSFVSRRIKNELVAKRMKFLALDKYKNLKLLNISSKSIPLSISSVDPFEDNESNNYIECCFDGKTILMEKIY